MREHKIQISNNKCIGCGMCERDCPVHNIAMKNKKAAIKSQKCIMCGHCVAICPKAADSITGFDELPMEIEKPIILDDGQLMDAIRTRRTIRQFKDKSVAPDIIAKIIEAGRLTPSGRNAQDVSYIVLQGEIRRIERIAVQLAKKLLPLVKLFSPATKNTVIDEHFFFKKAPVAIVVISKDKINASLAASNMALMAEANGLGVLYSGLFSIVANISYTLRHLLKLRKTKVVTTLVLGYPNVNYRRTVQKESAVVRYL